MTFFFFSLDSHTTVNNSEVSRVVHSHDLLNLDNVREFCFICLFNCLTDVLKERKFDCENS